MSWAVRLPFRSRDDTLFDVVDAARESMEGEERAVAQALAFNALKRGTTSASDLIDELETAGPAGRRQLLDQARESAGLLTTTDEEGHREYLRANEAIARRDRPPLPTCPVCGVHPTGPGGMPEAPRVRKWHCPAHLEQAQPGDMEPPPLPIDPATMTLIDPDEAERIRREDAAREEAHRQKLKDRELEAAERAAAEASSAERWRPSGPGWEPGS